MISSQDIVAFGEIELKSSAASETIMNTSFGRKTAIASKEHRSLARLTLGVALD